MKKWINTAVANALYADKPNEVTRLSLLRAKFAENLAEAFGLKAQKDELFLMGLFSVLDVILEKPMAEALKVVHVAGEISNALIYRIGVLAPVYDFMLQYETANWAEVSRLMLLKNIDMNTVYEPIHRREVVSHRTLIVLKMYLCFVYIYVIFLNDL